MNSENCRRMKEKAASALQTRGFATKVASLGKTPLALSRFGAVLGLRYQVGEGSAFGSPGDGTE